MNLSVPDADTDERVMVKRSVDPATLYTRMIARLESLRQMTLLEYSELAHYAARRRPVPAPRDNFDLEVAVYLGGVGSLVAIAEPRPGDTEPHYEPGGLKIHLLHGVVVTVAQRETLDDPVLDVTVFSSTFDPRHQAYLQKVLVGLCSPTKDWLDD